MLERRSESKICLISSARIISNQLVASMSEDGETVQPDHRSAVASKAESLSAALDHEDAFVSGALRVSEDCISLHTAS